MKEKLSDAVLGHAEIMKSFKKERYPKAFMEYKERYYPVIEAISLGWEEREEEDKEAYLDGIAAEYLEEIKAALDTAGKNKIVRHDRTDGFRMVQALYTIPMIRDTKLPVAEALAEKIVESWKKEYPKYIYGVGDYETLKDGFDKKQFCYITTAVCETLGRPDNCYELTMFRQFRDGYLRKQPGGEELVEAYYQQAPGILERIDRLAGKQEIYEEIWAEHLRPCLSLIEAGDREACKKQYIQMVKILEKKFQ